MRPGCKDAFEMLKRKVDNKRLEGGESQNPRGRNRHSGVSGPARHSCGEKRRTRCTRLLRRTITLLRLNLVLPFLFLFVRQRFLLVGVFLKQLLRLLLMLLFDKLFFGGIGWLLREFRVFLLLLLLDAQTVQLLLCAELILLLLVLAVQFGVRGGWNHGPWRSRGLVGMDC